MFSDQPLSNIKIKKSKLALDGETPPNTLFYMDTGEVFNQRTVIKRHLISKIKCGKFLVLECIYNMPGAPLPIVTIIHGKFSDVSLAQEMLSHLTESIQINGGKVIRNNQLLFKEFSKDIITGDKPSLVPISNLISLDRNAYALQVVKSGLRVFIKSTEYGEISMTEASDIASNQTQHNLITPAIKEWVDIIMSASDSKGLLVEAFVDGENVTVVDACYFGVHDLSKLNWGERDVFLSSSDSFNDSIRYSKTTLENTTNILKSNEFIFAKEISSLFPTLIKETKSVIMSPAGIEELILVDVSKLGLFAEGVENESIEVTFNYPTHKHNGTNKNYSYSKSETGFIAI